jgi:hypothetical protein
MQELRKRLLAQVEKVPGPLETECWLMAHPILRWKDRVGRVSRFSYLAFVGPIKQGNYVLHKCDVGGCVNPDHLWQGTPQENVQDAIAKGRFWASRRKPINQPMERRV